jgi:hypothetical protein
MATIWFSRDGSRLDTQRAPGIDVSMGEILAVFEPAALCFVGAEAPSINPGRPSHFERNVVLEISALEGGELYATGFYLVVGVEPEEAMRKLSYRRAAAASSDGSP